MKTRSLITILLLAVATVTQAQSAKTVDLPYVAHSNTTALEISKVTITDDATILDIDAFFRPNWWIRVVSDSYLYVDGKKYMITDGEDIELDSLFWMPDSGEASFRLIFDPIPTNSTSFDFIESDCGDCFKIWGVDLTNSKHTSPNIPKEYLQTSNTESTIVSDWKKGKAKVSGQLLGYRPNIDMKAKIIYFNPITSKEKITPIDINDDGTFSAEVDMYNPSQVMLTYDAPQADEYWFIVAPNEETKVIVNLAEANRIGSKLRRESPSYGETILFAGYAAQINRDLNSRALMRGDYFLAYSASPQSMNDILGMTIQEYSDYMMKKYEAALSDNNALDVSEEAKKIANIEIAFGINMMLMSAESYLTMAQMDANQISWEEASETTRHLKKDADFNNYLKQLSSYYLDEDILLIKYLPRNVQMLSYVRSPENSDPLSFYKYLLSLDNVKSEDKDVISDFLKEDLEYIPDDYDGPITQLFVKYNDLAREFLENISGVNYLSNLWDIQDGLLINLIRSNNIIRDMDDFITLTKKQKEGDIKNFPSIMQNIILNENEALLAKIEENKKKTGYTILETPDVDDSILFEEMIKQFKGKVILVDMWATWCGPCIAANREMDPIKAQLADQDIVYLYLAGENSPLNTWENMITDLPGYHYRVSEMNWAYLTDLLKSSGVPTYIIIDKEGNQTFHSVGFPGASSVVNELKKNL